MGETLMPGKYGPGKPDVPVRPGTRVRLAGIVTESELSDITDGVRVHLDGDDDGDDVWVRHAACQPEVPS
jgi:hypothetical protein